MLSEIEKVLKRRELTALLAGMNVPVNRRDLNLANLSWLGRNLAIQNGQHPNFGKARAVIVELLKR